MSIHFDVVGGNGNHHTNDKGAHEQSVSELTANLKKLVEEYKLKHPVLPQAGRIAKKVRDTEAEAWARKEEPKRDLPYLLHTTEGVQGDTEPRKVNGNTYKGTSSIVDSVDRFGPNLVGIKFNGNGKTYTYGGSARDIESFLTRPSMGSETGKARNGTSSTIRAFYHSPRGKK